MPRVIRHINKHELLGKSSRAIHGLSTEPKHVLMTAGGSLSKGSVNFNDLSGNNANKSCGGVPLPGGDIAAAAGATYAKLHYICILVVFLFI